MRWYFLLHESLQSAYRTVVLNKLRTLLSLLGVTIGIFSIISVFSVLDSMKSNMKKSLDSFGTDVVVVEKWPWAPEEGTEFAWWEYLNRPVVTMREHDALKSRMDKIQAACFLGVTQADIEYLDNTAENLQIWGVSEEFEVIRSFDLARGRFLTALEINSGRNICVIGYTIAEELFQGQNPLGRSIRFKGKDATVVGVFSKEGKSLLNGGSMDNVILIPVRFFATVADMTTDNANPQIWIKPVEGFSVDELKEELQLNMRSIRRLSPRTKNNFALNETSLMSGMIEQIFAVVNVAGWFIGIFAVLVGAFGIANIMFVSVKERTNIIGIQKALGAKSYYIILEVLNESVLLSLIGGLLGLLLIYIGTFLAKGQGFEIFLSMGNIITGLLISSTVGLIAGLMPALSAARLDPVKAIASTF
ncbi:MAG TPA: ABC transporter permease [Bacteroidales bacterium]|jgi:putative ABC transport system permease protein|nr:ABC transporter permease [Bacteroidales bacterium]